MDLALLLILAALLSPTIAEVLDVTGIYRLQHATNLLWEYPTASLEIHTGSNMLGRVFRAPNGTYVEPSVGMPHLDCVNAGERCSWLSDDSWDVTHEDMSDVLPRLTFSLEDSHAFPECCEINNGGCQETCEMLNTAIVCSCPHGYELVDDDKTCMPEGITSTVLTNTSSYFTSPNYPENYDNNLDTSWLIVAPQGYRIRLTFQDFQMENTHDYVKLFDGNTTSASTLGHFSGALLPSDQFSTHNMMLVTFHTDGSSTQRGFSAKYVAETANIIIPIKSLQSETGMLRSSPVLPTFPGLCVSIIHRLATSSNTLNISADLPNGRDLKLTQSHYVEIGSWKISRFKATLSVEDIEQPLTMTVHLTGQGSAVFSIMGCNPYENEDTYIVKDSISTCRRIHEAVITPDIQSGATQRCYNGGMLDSQTDECHCPAGFIGPDCYDSCGPYMYGHDCEKECSSFKQDCVGVIFCKPKLPCLCAPGITGKFCNIQCDYGYYGASCRRRCGLCRHGECDIYTGRCRVGCRPGYYPPLCQDTYQHLAEAPTVENTDLYTASIGANLSSVAGRGTTRFYQVQYKEQDSVSWQELQPQEPKSKIILSNITGLGPGIHYQVRVIIIDSDGNSYQGSLVPTAQLQTLCTVPTSREYQLQIEDVTASSFQVSWKYNILSTNWCPLTGFEVISQYHGQQLQYNTSPADSSVMHSGLFPGRQYQVRLRAVTEHGKAPFSPIMVITTADHAPREVTRLEAVPGETGKLRISWDKPWFTAGTIRNYHVEYQCLRLLACSEPCEHSTGHFEVSAQSVVLIGLLPHAQYTVRVAGMAAALGPFSSVDATTDYTDTNVAPNASPIPITASSNTSFAVQWQAPSNCSGLNGFMHGYRYELVASEDAQAIVLTGSTQDIRANFTDLKPDSQYQVQVYVETSAGYNPTHKLIIPATTSATTPDQVQDLTVYKQGRHMIGIRWAPPLLSYGDLKSFTVTHHRKDRDASTAVSETLAPVSCTAWPKLYCHTINGLIPNTQYLVAVKARNSEVDADGSAVTVKATTREGAPTAPTSLRVLNRTQTSLMLEWGLPNMINGILRSFLVNVEQTDSINVTDCCEYFPIQELPTSGEEQFYHLEVGGLRPASILTVSVSAKTVSIGQSVNVMTTTPPDPPTNLIPPEVRTSEKGFISVSLQAKEEYPGINSTYLLLVLPLQETAEPAIWNMELRDQLRTAVNQTFYMVAQYQPEELLAEEEVHLGTGAAPSNGTLGYLQDPQFTPGTYRAGLALVLSYGGATSVSFVASEPFTVA